MGVSAARPDKVASRLAMPLAAKPRRRIMTERDAERTTLEIQFDGTDLYVVFNGVRIAKRGAKGTPQARTWVSLEPGYRVLDRWKPRANRKALTSDIIVEYNGVRVQ
jgi:hypothetical protein